MSVITCQNCGKKEHRAGYAKWCLACGKKLEQQRNWQKKWPQVPCPHCKELLPREYRLHKRKDP